MKMQKRLRVAVLAVCFIFVGYLAYAQTLTVSTYYPSPYGSYVDLEVTGTATIGTLRGGSYGFGGVYVENINGCETPNPFTEHCVCPDGFSAQTVPIGGAGLFVCYK